MSRTTELDLTLAVDQLNLVLGFSQRQGYDNYGNFSLVNTNKSIFLRVSSFDDNGKQVDKRYWLEQSGSLFSPKMKAGELGRWIKALSYGYNLGKAHWRE